MGRKVSVYGMKGGEYQLTNLHLCAICSKLFIRGYVLSAKKEVIKHSGAIQIANEISLLQRRAWNVLLANAYDELPYNEEHQLPVRELAEVLHFDSKNIQYLKETLKALTAALVEWNILSKDGEEWGVASLLAECRIINGICHYAYGPTFRKRLYNPAMYARISLSLQNRFKSKYALAIYELCLDYFNLKKQRGETPWIELEHFRKLLGIQEGQYKEFKDLKKWTLVPALKEINQKSNLKIKVEIRKKGRKIGYIKLIIWPHDKNIIDINKLNKNKYKQAVLPLPEFEIENQELLHIMITEFSVSKDKAIALLKEHDEFHIQDKILYARRQRDAGKIKTNLGGFLVRSIEQNWVTKMETEKIREEKEEKRKALAAKEKAERAAKDAELEMERKENAEIETRIEALSPEEKAALEDEARNRVLKKMKPGNPGFEFRVGYERRELFKTKWSGS